MRCEQELHLTGITILEGGAGSDLFSLAHGGIIEDAKLEDFVS